MSRGKMCRGNVLDPISTSEAYGKPVLYVTQHIDPMQQTLTTAGQTKASTSTYAPDVYSWLISGPMGKLRLFQMGPS